MRLIRASIHNFETKTGEMVEYARLMYRSGGTTIGQSLLLCRLSPEQLRLARQGYREA